MSIDLECIKNNAYLCGRESIKTKKINKTMKAINRNGVIQAIQHEVDKNSREGKLTKTSYVGEFNYKSGYDTFYAVSYNQRRKLIVYSYYRNDRGELLGKYQYQLQNLTDEQLAKVYMNLNKTTEENTSKYTQGTEDLNLETLSLLGIYDITKEKQKLIDTNSIPKLEDENDAYYIDKDETVHVLKCAGFTPHGRIIFASKRQPTYYSEDQAFYQQLATIEYGDETPASKAFFIMENESDLFGKHRIGRLLYMKYNSGISKIFARDKEAVLLLAKLERQLKEYYVVGDERLTTFKALSTFEPAFEGCSVFSTRKKAIKHFSKLKKKLMRKVNELKADYSQKKSQLIQDTGFEDILEKPVCLKIQLDKDKEALNKDQKYYHLDRNGKPDNYGPFRIKEIDENDIIHLEDGHVMEIDRNIFCEREFNKLNAKNQFKEEINEVKTMEDALSCLDIDDAQPIFPYVPMRKPLIENIYAIKWLNEHYK